MASSPPAQRRLKEDAATTVAVALVGREYAKAQWITIFSCVEPLWWCLARGACLGGDATPIGAAATSRP
jgi:Na+/H+ antiporter NhaD/arsenite permease-like protein